MATIATENKAHITLNESNAIDSKIIFEKNKIFS
jgi:hypothetical protein